MANLLTEELEALRKFRLRTERGEQELSIHILDLLEKDRLHAFLKEDLKLKRNTDQQHAMGSMFVKRYAFLAALVLYSMSVFNKKINCSLENITIQTDAEDPLWSPGFYFSDLNVTKPETDREQWRESLVQMLFLENISKIITTISKHTKISKTILWENISVYIFWMYETLVEDKSLSGEKRTMIEEDFHFVVSGAAPQLFGMKARNPLSQFYVPKQNGIRPRKTCCLFYLTSEQGGRCKTCPNECKRPE